MPRRFLAASAVAGALLDVEMEALFAGTAFVSGAQSSVEDPLQTPLARSQLERIDGGRSRRCRERIGRMENFLGLCVRRMTFRNKHNTRLLTITRHLLMRHEDRWPLIYSLIMSNPVTPLNDVIPNEVLRGNSKPKVLAIRVRPRSTRAD